MPIKTLGSLGKIRVGRVTGNTHISFFGLMYVDVKSLRDSYVHAFQVLLIGLAKLKLDDNY